MYLGLVYLKNPHFSDIEPRCYLATNHQISLPLHGVQYLSMIHVDHYVTSLHQVIFLVNRTCLESWFSLMHLRNVSLGGGPLQVGASMIFMLVDYKFGVRYDKLFGTHVAGEHLLVNAVSLAKMQLFRTVLPEIAIGEPTRLKND